MFGLLTLPFRITAKAVTIPIKIAILPVKAITYPSRCPKKEHKQDQEDLAKMLLLAEIDDLIGY